MKGDEVLVMTSLVIIFAVFLQRRRSFIQQMRLMSLQMRKMRRNLLILSIQQRRNIQCHNWDKRKTLWVYPRPQFWFKDLAEEMENPMGSVGFYFVLFVQSLFHSSDFFKFELQSMFMVL